MDPSVIIKEVSTPKVIPLKMTIKQKRKLAAKRAAKKRREERLRRNAVYEYSRRGAGRAGKYN